MDNFLDGQRTHVFVLAAPVHLRRTTNRTGSSTVWYCCVPASMGTAPPNTVRCCSYPAGRRELPPTHKVKHKCKPVLPGQHTSPAPSSWPSLDDRTGGQRLLCSLFVCQIVAWNCSDYVAFTGIFGRNTIELFSEQWIAGKMLRWCSRLDNDPRDLPTQFHHCSIYYPRTVHVLRSRITDTTPHSPTSSKPFQKY